MKRRILLVDDELAILLTLKAVLELHGFDVETAASAREAKSKLRAHPYHMVITDMRMENERAGIEVVRAAREAEYDPAVAMLTAFYVDNRRPGFRARVTAAPVMAWMVARAHLQSAHSGLLIIWQCKDVLMRLVRFLSACSSKVVV